jgi:hypothetical protein
MGSCALRKITFGEMRSAGGPTGIMVYCTDYQCSHSIAMAADQWPDHVRLSDIEPRFVCRAWQTKRRRPAALRASQDGGRRQLNCSKLRHLFHGSEFNFARS